MNILFLNYEFPPLGGGASPVSYEIARAYASRGHMVDVVTMGYTGLPRYEILDGINVYRVPCLRSKKEICHPWEQLSYLLSAYLFLRRRLKQVHYDVNHTHFIIPTGVLARWLKKRYGLDYVVTAHGSDVLGYNQRFARLYPILKKPWNRIVEEARWVTAPSDFLIQKIKEVARKGNFQIVSNGLDMTRFKPGKKEKRILMVSRLFVNKGIQDALDALAQVDLNGWEIDIVGDGPYRMHLESKVRDLGLNAKVHFHGWIDNASAEMSAIYGRSSIFISASYFESFGQTVLEAISAGCYPLISDIGGHRYIVKNDRYFFEVGNASMLAKKIADVMNKGPRSVSIDVSAFTWDRVITNYIQLLEKR